MTTKHVPIQIWNELKKIRNRKDRLTGKRRTREQIQEILLNKYGYKVSLRTIERRLPLKIDEQLDMQINNQTIFEIKKSIDKLNENLSMIAYQLYATNNKDFIMPEEPTKETFLLLKEMLNDNRS
jgi:transposase